MMNDGGTTTRIVGDDDYDREVSIVKEDGAISFDGLDNFDDVKDLIDVLDQFDGGFIIELEKSYNPNRED